MSADDLVGRLERRARTQPAVGSASVSTSPDGTAIVESTIYDDGMRYVNPDGPEAAARIRELTEEVERLRANAQCGCGYDDPAHVCEFHQPLVERATKVEVENVRLRDALEAIIDRGPERNVKWAGMTARDIAIQALQRKEG